jgi:hypothetical protein
VLGGVSAETGTIDDPTGTTFYGFPGIAVNRLGAATISYCYYSASIHPSLGYSYRDPTGVMSSGGTISNGTNVPSERRWGDFTTTVVDPINDLEFWVTGPSATSQIWSTWWGVIHPPLPPARIRAVRH